MTLLPPVVVSPHSTPGAKPPQGGSYLLSASRRCRGAGGYDIEASLSFDGMVRNHVQGKSDGNDGDTAVLVGDQPAPGTGNASFASVAPVGGAAVAAASVFGRQRVFFAGRGGDVFGREHNVDRDCWPL